MTIAQALNVRDGATVISKYTSPPLKPLRVTRVWANDAKTIVRFRIAKLGDAWVDSEGFEVAPKGKKWAPFKQEWV
jgi:hypothetical protein